MDQFGNDAPPPVMHHLLNVRHVLHRLSLVQEPGLHPNLHHAIDHFDRVDDCRRTHRAGLPVAELEFLTAPDCAERALHSEDLHFHRTCTQCEQRTAGHVFNTSIAPVFHRRGNPRGFTDRSDFWQPLARLPVSQQRRSLQRNRPDLPPGHQLLHLHAAVAGSAAHPREGAGRVDVHRRSSAATRSSGR